MIDRRKIRGPMVFLFLVLAIDLSIVTSSKKSSKSLVENVGDHKDLKKLLRTKNNVFVIFSGGVKASSEAQKILVEVADLVKGLGTVAAIDCAGDGKKLCKKLKVNTGSYVLKHYKDGDFHKDYDRNVNVQSIVTFLKDPTGDLPWNEDSAAADVVHLANPVHFNKFFKQVKGKVLTMFYAPWCGHCKRMKPDYQAAATELKGEAMLAALDASKPENSALKDKYNVTGFPTMLFFEQGTVQYAYPGGNDKQSIINFLKDPKEEKAEAKPAETAWADEESEVVHLTDSTFDTVMGEESSVLVMFYAPWCGHCKKAKPHFTKAAEKMKNDGIAGKLAAVDCTKETGVCKKFGVSGYPTIKYFKDGEVAFDAGQAREEDSILKFMKDPQEPPPPPPPEPVWSDEVSDVAHLTDETFKPFLKKKKHVLVMFYAPWCGHCKRAKPEFAGAAAEYAENPKVEFGAVDCTIHQAVCSTFEVRGYPTIKYFHYLNKEKKDYQGGRTQKDFVDFMSDPQSPFAGQPPPPPPAWSDEKSEVVHLTDATFDTFMGEESSVLIMFYAPWCGHCKKAKPHFTKAAEKMKNDGIAGKLAAVDCTKENICKKFDVNGYPTIKYFKDGKFAFEAGKAREEESIIKFMKDPQEPPPPPPPEPAWSDEVSDVEHLTDETFKPFLKKKEHVLVMFYTPWCGHCKRAKPEFAGAAAEYAENPKVEFGAVDCTIHQAVCSTFEVRGYPTIKYFHYLNKEKKDYEGGRTKKDFISFMSDPLSPLAGKPPPPPSPEDEWKDLEGSIFMKHLRSVEFDEFLQYKDNVLIMFYAPWCGHCKRMKPDYAAAAKQLTEDQIPHVLATVDATLEPDLAKKYGVQGYPTLKFFRKGEMIEDYNGGRKKDDIVNYIKKQSKKISLEKNEL